MITVHEVLAGASELAPLPPTAVRIAEVLDREDGTVDEVAEIIAYDQALTAQVLRMANSVYSAAAREITTVREAVIRLGGGRILEWLAARHLRPAMTAALPSYGYSENDLWRHSVAAAVSAEVLAGMGPGAKGLSFAAAVLHDIGKLLIGRQAPPELMERIWDAALGPEPRRTCEEAERMVLGFSHADVGALLASAWGLPGRLVKAVRDHHREQADPDVTTDHVKVANLAARVMGEGVGYEGMNLALSAEVAQRSGLTKGTLEKLCALSAERLAGVFALYEVH